MPALKVLITTALGLVQPLSENPAIDTEAKLFYLMLLGDLHRYHSEVLHGEEQDLAADDAATK